MSKVLVSIFGSTGDLAARKILPSLVNLKNNFDLQIIAIGRREMNTSSYIDFIIEKSQGKLKENDLNGFVEYLNMKFTDEHEYEKLYNKHQGYADVTKRLYYLAVGPDFFEIITKSLSDNQLVEKNNIRDVIAFEKPFGEDLESAKRINNFISRFLTERQIFRIDHYLGKEMIQNIMMLRFANRVIEDSWTKESIKSIKIFVKEKEGILNRSGYYDRAGALRDMMQSHVLQIASLLTMEPPKSYLSDDVKDKKVNALVNLEIDHKSTILAQYEGYLSEKGIPKNSNTETFVFLKGFVKTKKFNGIPIYMLTGKKIDDKSAYIDVEFKETAEQKKWHLPLSKNILRISIAPEDGFYITLNSKVPGLRDQVKSVKLGYKIESDNIGNLSEAYEKLFSDIFGHHRTLFTRWDEIKASWNIIESVLKENHNIYKYDNFEDIINIIKEQTGVDMS